MVENITNCDYTITCICVGIICICVKKYIYIHRYIDIDILYIYLSKQVCVIPKNIEKIGKVNSAARAVFDRPASLNPTETSPKPRSSLGSLRRSPGAGSKCWSLEVNHICYFSMFFSLAKDGPWWFNISNMIKPLKIAISREYTGR